MINLNEKSRSPKDEILTQTFLINKITNDMKTKYKKIFSLINYNECLLKSDIHKLISKYISSKKKEINIKFIETTILNKVREKYKHFKNRPLEPIGNTKNRSLIKLVYPTQKHSNSKYYVNSYLNLNPKTKTISAKKKNNTKNLSPIKNKQIIKKNDSAENITNLICKYNKLQENNNNSANCYNTNDSYISSNHNNNINEYENSKGDISLRDSKCSKGNNEILQEINEDNNKIKEIINNSEENIQKNILEEQEEIKALERYKAEIQKEINEIDKEIEKQDKMKNIKNNEFNHSQEIGNSQNILNKEEDTLSNKAINNNCNINNNSNINNNINNISTNNVNSNECGQDSWIYPKMSREQKHYLEIKKRIEEDFYNRQNRYIFVKPKKNTEKEAEENNNYNKNNNYQYDNFRINKYSMERLNEYNKIKEKIQQEKEKNFRNNSGSKKNIFDKKNQTSQQFEENIKINNNHIPNIPKIPNFNANTIINPSMPIENKIQLKILQRSLEQQRAFEHLRNLMYPQRQLLVESEYQGFDTNRIDKNEVKKTQYELADEARKIQIEKMKMMLDSSIGDKKMKILAEKEIEKKYREMWDKEHELFLQNEKQKKSEKARKTEKYRKMLDEQIQAKKKAMLDENNLSDINKELIYVE